MAKTKSGCSLVEPFRTNAKAFIKALEDAGATVTISLTRRSLQRAYLFHWCWRIGLGKVTASAAKPMPGVEIEWDHGDELNRQEGAIKAPALNTNHAPGKPLTLVPRW